MVSKRNVSKLHHYVPQAYLRGFGTEKSQIAVVPLEQSRKRFVSSVKNVAAIKHFHTVDGLDEPDAFEKALSAVEADASEIIRSFDRGDFPLSELDRWTFSYYMAIQSVRGPDTRATIEHISAQATRLEIGAGGRKNLSNWIKNNFGSEASDEDADRIWTEATQPDGPPIRLSNLAHIEHTLEAAQDLTVDFATRPWTLVRFDRRSLITSDAPVSLIANPNDQPWEGVGFATAWGISFPLTRKLGLLMSDPMALFEKMTPDHMRVQEIREAILHGKIDRKEPGTTKMEKLFNQHTATTAKEYVFYHPDDLAFVPEDLPGPDLVNIRASGIEDFQFDGEPWFGS